jgi:hypothetical protein
VIVYHISILKVIKYQKKSENEISIYQQYSIGILDEKFVTTSPTADELYELIGSKSTIYLSDNFQLLWKG